MDFIEEYKEFLDNNKYEGIAIRTIENIAKKEVLFDKEKAL